MRSTVAVTLLLAGLGFAQDLPMDDYEDIVATVVAEAPPFGQVTATPTVTYDQASAISEATSEAVSLASEAVVSAAPTTLLKRVAACTTRSFNGPQVTDPADSDAAFLAYAPFTDTAVAAAADESKWPGDYKLIPGFVNLHGSGQSTSYQTYTAKIDGYNLDQCAARCDSIVGCVAFNIYYERDPLIVWPDTQTPNVQYCPATNQSPSATLIKCSFYNKPLKVTEATNVGQYQEGFHLVIAGSNAYAKAAPRLTGYANPVSFGNAAINAPAPVSANGYMRIQTFGTDVPLDPQVCADSCAAQSDYNSRHGGPQCVFFNAYLLYKNGANPVFTCTYYSQVYGTSRATNVGQYNSKGDHFTIGSSYGYTLLQQK